MAPQDHQFIENQAKTPTIGYCTGLADRKWMLSEKRKKRDIKVFANPVEVEIGSTDDVMSTDCESSASSEENDAFEEH